MKEVFTTEVKNNKFIKITALPLLQYHIEI